jgi:hypothetical protein
MLSAVRLHTDLDRGAGQDDAVDFVQEVGPLKGRVTGRMSPDGLRGWRLDWDKNKGFHVNWWIRPAARSGLTGYMVLTRSKAEAKTIC